MLKLELNQLKKRMANTKTEERTRKSVIRAADTANDHESSFAQIDCHLVCCESESERGETIPFGLETKKSVSSLVERNARECTKRRQSQEKMSVTPMILSRCTVDAWDCSPRRTSLARSDSAPDILDRTNDFSSLTYEYL